MLLQQEILISDHKSRCYAKVKTCDFNIEQTMFGYRLNFSFRFEPNSPDKDDSTSLLRWEVDLYYQDGGNPVLMGRTLSDLNEDVHELNSREFTIRKHFEIRADDFVRLIDKTYRGDITFEFHTIAHLSGDYQYPDLKQGRLVVPHSTWLDSLNKTGLDRYELITIRVPVASSHLHKPFVDAVVKIREAERQYSKGDWNGAAASCRAAWNTILSSAPSGVPKLEHLLASVIGEPRRKEFAMALIKGLHDVLNKAVHLEGDVKTGTPPANLKPEDALLCIHWYAATQGYLSSI